MPTSQIVFDQTLAANASVSVKWRGIAGTGIPDSADVSALAGNLVVFNPTANGNVSVYPAGGTKPAVGQVYYYADDNISNFIIAELAADGRATITNNSAASVRIGFNAQGYYTKAATGTATDNGATYAPLPGGRVVSTAEGVGVPGTDPVGPNETLTFDLSGKVGLPEEGLGPVVLSVTARQPTTGGIWYQVYTAGGTRPDWAQGSTDPNMGQRTTTVIVQPDAEGKVSIYNQSGSASIHFLVDVQGWYVPSTGTAPGGSFTPLPVKRILDTAAGVGVPTPGPVAGEEIVDLQVTGAGGVPATGVHAVALNLWITGAETNGYLRVFPTGGTQTLTVIVGYQRLRVAGNLVSTHLSADGKLSIRNISTGQVNLYADVYGYWKAPTKPQPPTNVTATVGDSEAFVSWTPPANDGGATVTEYTVTASPGGATKTVEGNAPGAAFTGLANGTPYSFTVKATNAVGASEVSAASEAVTPRASRRVSAPTITDVYGRDGAVRVSWAHPASGPDGIVSYEIEASPGGATATVDGQTLEHVLTGLTNDTAYTITVTPINDNGRGATSTPSREVMPRTAEVPQQPAGLLATGLDGRIDVQWVPPSDGGAPITGYVVTAEPGAHRIEMPADTTVTAFTGLTNGVDYTVEVTANNKTGTSQPATAQATASASRAPAPPTGLVAAPAADGVAALEWEAPSDNGTHPITEYTVTASPGGATRTTAGTQIEFDGLDPDQAYSFTVAARSAAGTGDVSVATEPIHPRLGIKQEPVVLSEASIAQLQQAGVPGDGTLIFADPLTAQLAAIKTNDLIVIKPNPTIKDGYLARVTEATTGNGLLRLRTTRASHSDVYEQAEVSITSDAADLAGETPSIEPGVEFRKPIINGKTAEPGKVGTLASGIEIHENKVIIVVEKEFAPGGEPGDDGPVKTKLPYLKFRSTNEFHGSISFNPFSLDPHFAFNYRHVARLDVEAGLALEAAGNLDRILTKIRLKTKVFTIAKRIPGWIDFNWVSSLKVEASGSLGIKKSWTSSSTINGTCVPKLPDPCFGSGTLLGWTPVGDGLDPIAEGSVTLSMPMDYEALLYGGFGPALILKPYVTVASNFTNNPWVTGTAGVTLGASFNNPINNEWARRDDYVQLYKFDFLPDSGAFRGLEVSPGNKIVQPGEEIAFAATPRGGYPPDLPISWRIGSGSAHGSINSAGVFTANSYGVVLVEAYNPTADDGGELVGTAAVVIWDGGPPGAATGVTAKPTVNGVALNWTQPTRLAPAITRYNVHVQRVDGGGQDHRVYPFEDAVDHARIDELQPGRAYKITVAAVNPAGEGPQAQPMAGGVVHNPVPYSIASELPIQDFQRQDLARDPKGAVDDTATAGRGGAAGADSYVYFLVQARSNVAPLEIRRDRDTSTYVIRKDIFSGETTVASRGADGRTPIPVAAAELGRSVSASRDGSTVAFRDTAGNVLIHRVDTHHTWTIGASTGGLPVLNANGKTIAYINRDLQVAERRTQAGGVLRLDDCGTACAFPDSVDISDDGNKILVNATDSNNDASLFLYDQTTLAMTNLVSDNNTLEEAKSGKISGDGTTVTSYYEEMFVISGLAVKRLDGTRLDPDDVVIFAGDATLPLDISANGQVVAYRHPPDPTTDEARIQLYGSEGDTTASYVDGISAPVTAELNSDGTRVIYTLFDWSRQAYIPGVWMS